ncbi:ABC transporter permease subunit [Bacillaceae bacterium SIJ1]|uniref:ABC transporter permease n=1 Tax=Litoribacterium kuwaitense TaxID=1398745 RepID=UPI0013E9DE22|nr:ABC transporter permease [Litoribacterium kuwaitense]NGP44275.1 ABC transporter permease subunit [Litoribacterium kuwaitense]
MKQLWMNPVLQKELKLRFRSGKSAIGMGLYTGILSLSMLSILALMNEGQSSLVYQPDNGRVLFVMMSMFQLGLILFVVPALTAGVISGERERQTLQMLLVTNQSSMSIVIGKLFASLAYMILLVLSTAPIYAIIFLYGGLSLGEVAQTFLMYLFIMLTIGAVGLAVSALIRRTIVAIITTYAITFAFSVGTVFLTYVSMAFAEVSQQQTVWAPFIFSSLSFPLMLLEVMGVGFIDDIIITFGHQSPGISSWLLFFSVYFMVIITGMIIAIRKLRPNMKQGKRRVRKGESGGREKSIS